MPWEDDDNEVPRRQMLRWAMGAVISAAVLILALAMAVLAVRWVMR